MPTASSRRRASTCTTCPASTTSSTRSKNSIANVTAAARKARGWYSFDANGVHFIGLVNVVDLKAGVLNLGNAAARRARRRSQGRFGFEPIVVFAHIPLWTVYPTGLGHRG